MTDTSTEQAKCKVRMSAAQRREQLITIGRQLFAERGFDATSIEEVAARAKVSKPVVYEHFGGKEGLYAVVVDRETQRLLTRITDSLEGDEPHTMLLQAANALQSHSTSNVNSITQRAAIAALIGLIVWIIALIIFLIVTA